MKNSTILSLLLLGSVILNAFLYFREQPPIVPSPPNPGFAKPDSMTRTMAAKFANEYQESLKAPDSISGGYITRDAITEMLNKEGCNGIYYAFAKDSLGETGPKNRGVFLLLTAANVKLNTNGQISTVTPLGSYFYKPRPWCPPNCILAKMILNE